ncbi:MAG: beta-ketoacyl synthase N-terminal-like domain-containing protein [Pirellulaceae bacterium]
MVGLRDIVITGIGCVSPLGTGRQAFRRALLAEQCAIRPRIVLSDTERTTYYAASVDDFDGKQYVTPRKAAEGDGSRDSDGLQPRPTWRGKMRG